MPWGTTSRSAPPPSRRSGVGQASRRRRTSARSGGDGSTASGTGPTAFGDPEPTPTSSRAGPAEGWRGAAHARPTDASDDTGETGADTGPLVPPGDEAAA